MYLHRFLVVDFLLALCPLCLPCESAQIQEIALGQGSATIQSRDVQIRLTAGTGIARHHCYVMLSPT